MTVLSRIGIGVFTAMIVAAILTLCGMSHGRPAAIGTIAGVIVQMKLRAAAKKVKSN
jgi:hypothetical protein